MARTKLTFGPPEVIVERRPDGAMLARSPHPSGRLSPRRDRLARPLGGRSSGAVFLAEWARGRRRGMAQVDLCRARAAARSVAQGLIDRGLYVERPVAILSGNGVDHALVGLGAMIAGVPYAPVSAPYSLLSKDFARLKAIIAILTPALSSSTMARLSARRSRRLCRERRGRRARTTRRSRTARVRWTRLYLSKPAEDRGSTPRRRRSGRTRSPSSCSPPARPARPRASSTPIA